MNVDPLTSAKRDFQRSAAYRREQERFFKEVEKRLKEDRAEDSSDAETADLATIAVLATESEIADFQADLDLYRTATTEALIENERQLAKVQKRLDAMLAQAYVLPDGRRVFKTKDGLRVFDEHGVELECEVVDPDAIEDWRPPADDYLVEHATKGDLLSEQEKLLSIERRLDTAEERSKSGEMTRDEMSEFRAELEATMPLAARRKLPGYEDAAVPDASHEFGLSASPTKAAAPDLKLDLPEFGR